MKKKFYKKKADSSKKIAKQRILQLFEQAEIEFKNDPKLSNRYVVLARKVATKNNARIPREFKRKFCKECNSYFVPNVTCRVRLQSGSKVVFTCLNCNHIMRFPYVREQKERRKKSD